MIKSNQAKNQEDQKFASDQLIVKPEDGADPAEIESAKQALGATVSETTQTLGIEFWKLTSNTSVQQAVKKLNKNPAFEYAEPDFIVEASDLQASSTTPNDPLFSDQWGWNNTGQTGGTSDADIDAPEAWDKGTDASNMVTGVIDSGVDLDHPDLNDNLWTNEDEIPGNGVDDDNNGYVDDVHGYDFADDDPNPDDDFSGHGTHVAGTVAAEGNNSTGVTGAGWNGQIMALRFLDNGGFTSDAIQAIEYAINNGADLTNNSWGGGSFSQGLKDAITAAQDAGQLFVAAAGNDFGNDNDENPVYPASYDNENIISVAATNDDDGLADFSNIGDETVDLGAPGEAILSTDIEGSDGLGSGDYETISGTSMASPHVAGSAALLWHQNPNLSWEAVKQTILDNTDPISALDGKTVTDGRLNLNKTVNFDASVAEVGRVNNVTDSTQTVNLTKGFNNPVVFAKPVSANGGDPANVRVSNVTGNSFTVQVQETENQDGTHIGESFSYLAVESGQWGLPNGSILEVGTQSTDKLTSQGWEAINFNLPFDNQPVIATQTQTKNGGQFVTTRQRNADSNGFELAMQEEEALNSGGHATENVGWMAITNGEGGEWSGNQFYAGDSDLTVDDNWNSTSFSNTNFNEAPNLIASLASYQGPDPAWTRYQNLSSSGVEFRSTEDQSADSETFHVAEQVDYLAIGGNGPLKGTDLSNGLGSISGTIFNDTNANGVQDSGESGISQRTVYVDSNGNGQFDSGELNTTTDSSGAYQFDNVEKGSYPIRQVFDSGETPTNEFGSYQVATSNDAGGPEFNWTDISPVGTELNLADDDTATVSLPFNFSLYDQTLDNIGISSNGYLHAPNSDGFDFTNDPIPNNAAPNGLIAPFWDDLNPSSGGSVYHHYDSSEERFIVQYEDVVPYAGSTEHSFQAILNQDGTVQFNYLHMDGATNGSTVGLENSDGSKGEEIFYNESFPSQQQFAIELTPDQVANVNHEWGSAESGINLGATTSSEGQAIAEVGRIEELSTSTQQPEPLSNTVFFEQSYENPVAIAQPLSKNEAQPAAVRIENVQSDRMTLEVQEPNYLDGSHALESISYFVVEEGQWQLSNGSLLQANTLSTNKLTSDGFEQVQFGSNFQQTPTIMSQLQSKNGGDFAVTRQRNADKSGFDVAMQEEEALNSGGHTKEQLGWVAMSPGSGNWNGHAYETSNGTVDGSMNAINFGQSFSSPPQLMGSVSSFNGGDPITGRWQNLTSSGVDVQAQEEQSADSETSHINEQFDYLAIEGTGFLTGSHAGPITNSLAEGNDLATSEPLDTNSLQPTGIEDGNSSVI